MIAESPADRLIIALRQQPAPLEDIPQTPEAKDVDSFHPDVQSKAFWCYRASMQALGIRPLSRDDFQDGYGRAWSVFYHSAATADSDMRSDYVLSTPLPQVLILHHFPEYPALVGPFRKKGVLVLVKRRAIWMDTDLTLTLDNPGILHRLLKHLKRGGTVAAMLDHSFSDTRNEIFPFLGFPCYTPVGLIILAAQFGFSVGVVAPPALQPSVISIPSDKNPRRLASSILSCLDDCILRAPERWLLWPNFNHRWTEATTSCSPLMSDWL